MQWPHTPSPHSPHSKLTRRSLVEIQYLVCKLDLGQTQPAKRWHGKRVMRQHQNNLTIIGTLQMIRSKRLGRFMETLEYFSMFYGQVRHQSNCKSKFIYPVPGMCGRILQTAIFRCDIICWHSQWECSFPGFPLQIWLFVLRIFEQQSCPLRMQVLNIGKCLHYRSDTKWTIDLLSGVLESWFA